MRTIAALLFILHVSADLELQHLRDCHKKDALKDDYGNVIHCRENILPCPHGYTCQKRKCCPLPILITTSTISSTTSNLCPEFNGCPGGVIVYDENNCSLCVIYDTCPGFPCPEHFYCFPSGSVLPNGQMLGQCYTNPCSVGSPLNDVNGFSVTCNVGGDIFECTDGYSCVVNEYNHGVCCPLGTTTISTTTSTTCPTVPDCTGGYIENFSGCDECIHFEYCPFYPCPDGLFCLSYKDSLIGACVSNPCSFGQPMDGDGTILCGTSAQCPGYSTCTRIDYFLSVCCQLETSTEYFTPTTTMECDGVIIIDAEGKPSCVYPDTCVQLGCGPGQICLVEEEGVLYPESSCVVNYCENLFENTAVSCNYSKICKPGYTCVPIPNDVENRGICCSSSTSTTSQFDNIQT